MSHALERVRGRNINVLPVTPEVGACAGILPDTDLSGGRSAMIAPTELRSEPTGPTRMAAQGADVASATAAAYAKLVADEAARWSKVVHAAGIEPQ